MDGETGELVWNPDAAALASVPARTTVPVFSGTGATADGHRVPLLANVGAPGDARGAADAQAEGVGLFRTEFCFLDREDPPSLDEQVAAYRAVLAAFPGRKVVVRTLDAGADKPLPFLSPGHEDNPALGVRGYRTSWSHPAILDTQLSAIARAAQEESARVAVMAPMIATVEEASAFVAAARAHGLAEAGIMVETPAAALLADRLVGVVDFVSLGTNDLAQYTMAADRLVGVLAPLNDPWQPAVLSLVAHVARAGADGGMPVGVCGEAASDPLLAAVLVGVGVTSLSMAPRALAGVADRLSTVTLEACRAAADAALAAADPGPREPPRVPRSMPPNGGCRYEHRGRRHRRGGAHSPGEAQGSAGTAHGSAARGGRDPWRPRTGRDPGLGRRRRARGARPVGGCRPEPGRQAAIGAGLGWEVHAASVNKVCLSGLTAVIDAARMLRAGDARVVVAAGMESMTRAPHLLPGSERGFPTAPSSFSTTWPTTGSRTRTTARAWGPRPSARTGASP